ncbi:MAG: malto-oligosyltrehalose synthase [Proteobacteria bacterium]|nr:malto-oligosyltrehalose synthase [Pseudomonadota bacterium]
MTEAAAFEATTTPLGDEELRRLCEAHGIEPGYNDIWGRRHEISPEAMRALLRAAGAFDPPGRAQGLPPWVVVEEGAASFCLPLAPGSTRQRLHWRVVDEAGTAHAGQAQPCEGGAHLRIQLALPWGYHRLTVEGMPGSTLLICAPQRCHEPSAVAAEGARLWGIAVQLYGLRSPRNWGIGDFGDLRQLVAQAGGEGAAFVGLNPLHALFAHNPAHASPYSPSSRAWLNAMYIEVEAAPGFGDCDAAQRLVRSPAFQQRLAALRAAPLVDHAGVWAAKHEVLELLFADFQERGQHDALMQDFRRFCTEGGEALRDQALFDALQAHLHAQDAQRWGWPAWPADWRDRRGARVRAFEREHARRVAFFQYLQWLAARQLAQAAQACSAAGMSIGLYLDLAVSVDRGGADSWRHAGCFAAGASIGAPPDLLNRQGQDWGLLPLRPDRLAQGGFAPVIEALRANMRGAGALRIDHVMMLMRLFWIPAGAKAADGAYVRYPHEALFAILALESRRHHCMVVGEDLGTVPGEMRTAMRRHGVLSYRLLYFQRDEQGAYLPPQDYPREAMVALSTHDLPTLAGWWSAADIRAQDALGQLPGGQTLDERLAQRANERERLAEAMCQPIEAPERMGEPPPPGLPAMVHAYLARTPSSLMTVQLEDLLGQAEQANMPGTVSEHPNWRRKYALELPALWQSPPLRQVLAAVADARPQRGAASIPRATYRLQLHKDFGFDAAAAVVPYLARLGISHVYCSPIHRARPGSLHGYDVVAHDEISPELGGMPAYRRLCEALQRHGMGQLIDLVPNHMGVLGGENAWWNDVLEKGAASLYAGFFDIDWQAATPGLAGKVLLPVLGAPYGEVLARGELSLGYEREDNRWSVRYFEHRFPVAPDSLFRRLQEALASGDQATLEREIDAINAPDGRESLHALMDSQAWRLAHWRCAADEINYRRFFDVNELAALRTEREDVFEATHGLALDLAAAGWVDGLRIDHPDGLFDPAAYFARLQAGHAARLAAAGKPARPLYVVAEKIAGSGEDVPLSWAIHGTTGYRFANVANAVLVDPDASAPLVALWHAFTGESQDFAEVAYEARLQVATGTLASDLEVLARALHAIAKADRRTRDHTLNGLREAIAAVAAGMPVYRTYNGEEASEQDERLVDQAIAAARERLGSPEPSLWAFLREALLGRCVTGASPQLLPDVQRFARRFQQYSAPVAAKGVEDTAFYRYFPLASLNEVGGEPDRIGLAVPDFHEASLDRQRRWPHTMLATSTHDSKRSEDVRLRIDVLSERVDAWRGAVMRWRQMNAPLCAGVLPAHEYLLYQTLVGALPAWPAPDPDFVERMAAYMRKAARESKRGTSWTQPDAVYEAALEGLVRGALAEEGGNAFLPDLMDFVHGLDAFSALSGLSLALLKFCSPGVPDVYQGCELIERSLVDPDNRRPVDYARRLRTLGELQQLAQAGDLPAAVLGLVGEATDGRAKMWAAWRVLQLRERMPALFQSGSYEALEARGRHAAHVVAFLRRHEGCAVLVIAVRLFAELAAAVTGDALARAPAWRGAAWGDTRVRLPADLAGCRMTDCLTGAMRTAGPETALSELLTHFPGAVLVSAAGA